MVSLQGADVTLPAIPLRPAGLTIVQAFVDLDGDGVQDAGEAGVGGVGVTLSGITVAAATTTPNGQVAFPGLPDGSYALSALPPAGYAPFLAGSVTLFQGGVVQVPLQLPGLVSGVVYGDWDGDGAQQPDEPLFRLPLTLTLSSGAGTQLLEAAGGAALFLGTPSGAYTLAATLQAVEARPLTLAAGQGAGAALALVGPGELRGAAWLDTNGDGLRQPWETPLAGVAVTLNGETTLTDATGRYVFGDVAPGTYALEVALPAGLTATIAPVQLTADRGAVVGIGAVQTPAFSVLLPLAINRP